MSMGVYIKNMEMPTICGKCNLFDASHAIGLFSPLGWCRVNGKEIFRLSEKADFCPLVPVPPHGDLIDRDALFKKCEFVCTDDDEDIREVRYSIIESAPTIIPAEEVKES